MYLCLMKKDDELFLLCGCHSMEHQIFISYDDELKANFIQIHLSKHRFFKRLWHGLKYIFGYQCRCGAFEEFILEDEGKKALIEHLNKN